MWGLHGFRRHVEMTCGELRRAAAVCPTSRIGPFLRGGPVVVTENPTDSLPPANAENGNEFGTAVPNKPG